MFNILSIWAPIYLDCTQWPNGAKVFMSILAILISIGLSGLVGYSVLLEYRRYKDEKNSYIEGVASKSEITAAVNTYIGKITIDTPFCLIFIDLDNFTSIQNAFGDQIVKRIINLLASRIIKVMPAQVQLGRYGIDQFIVFLKGEFTKNSAINLANDINDIIKESLKINENMEINVTASSSVAFYPVHGSNFKQLLDSLNIATYIAKKEGGDRVVVYSEEMGSAESENVKYYNQVKKGIQNKEFILHYQPIIDLRNGSVYGIEGLLRWQHPELGVLSPFNFINILEQSGDINWIGTWGLETLILEYNEIKQKFPHLDCQFSFNLSPKQLMNPEIAINFQKVLKKYRFAAKNIIIEIEQFIIFEQHEVIKNNILKLKEAGFLLAVDGFELDHSTLLKVQNLPIDIIKLDQSFLEENNNSSLHDRFTELLIEFAKQREITIIAERLENKTMIRNVLKRDIYLGQGYFFSKPVTDKELLTYLSKEDELKEKVDLDRVEDELLPDPVEEPIENIVPLPDVDIEQIKDELHEELKDVDTEQILAQITSSESEASASIKAEIAEQLEEDEKKQQQEQEELTKKQIEEANKLVADEKNEEVVSGEVVESTETEEKPVASKDKKQPDIAEKPKKPRGKK